MSETDTYLIELINSIFYTHSKEEYEQLENKLKTISSLHITLFLQVFRRNNEYHPLQILKLKEIDPNQYEKKYGIIHRMMGLFIPLYETYITSQLDGLDIWKKDILGEIMWFAEYWAIVSNDVTFLQKLLKDPRYDITIFHLLQLWEVFHYLFSDMENPEWENMKKYELDFPVEIDNEDFIDLHPEYKMTSKDVRDFFLHLCKLL